MVVKDFREGNYSYCCLFAIFLGIWKIKYGGIINNNFDSLDGIVVAAEASRKPRQEVLVSLM